MSRTKISFLAPSIVCIAKHLFHSGYSHSFGEAGYAEHLTAPTCAPNMFPSIGGHVPTSYVHIASTHTSLMKCSRTFRNSSSPQDLVHYSAASVPRVDLWTGVKQVHCPIGHSPTRPVSARQPEFFSISLHMPRAHTKLELHHPSSLYITLTTALIHSRRTRLSGQM